MASMRAVPGNTVSGAAGRSELVQDGTRHV